MLWKGQRYAKWLVAQLGKHGNEGKGKLLIVYACACPCCLQMPKDSSSARKGRTTNWPYHSTKKGAASVSMFRETGDWRLETGYEAQ
jgi:hypothetical protein